MTIHPAAAIFPLMSASEFAGLKADIAAHGLREPILIDATGAVIDGRNRLAACDELGIKPTFRTFTGESVVELVLSLNLHRRHLDESQRAMIGAKAKPLFEAEAANRRRATQNNESASTVRANLPTQDSGRARDHAARAANVSPRSVESAAAVLKKGTPELVQRVEQGDIKVSTAAAVAQQPEPEQKRLTALPIKQLRAELKKLIPQAAPLPTPAEARKQAIAAGAPVLANSGVYVLAMPKEQEDALGAYAVETRNLYDAIRLIAACSWTPEKFVAASEKWTCLEMERSIQRAYDYLERVMYAYARGEKSATGN